MAVKAIPDGYHSVTPYLIVEGAAQLIDFLKEAFGAQETFRMPGPGGIMHAEVRIGDSAVMMSDAMGKHGPMPTMLFLYVEDVDAIYRRARPPHRSRRTSSGATALARSKTPSATSGG